MKDKRAAKWAFLFYKESVPKDYEAILDGLHIPYMLSPWHDKDIDRKTGELKKPHKHGVLYFDSLKSYSQVMELLEPLNGPKYIEIVHSTKGMFDYFTHAENPNKASYNIEDIEYGSGFDLQQFFMLQDPEEQIGRILDIINGENINELSLLVLRIREEDPSLLRMLVAKSYFFSKYLDSRRNRKRK